MKHDSWIIRYWDVALFSIIVIIIYSVINWLTPVWCDDLDYGADGHTISDIFQRETHDYLYANGRIFSHSLVQMFVGIFGKNAFNLVNPIMTLLMIALVPIAAGMDFRNQGNRWKRFSVLFISLLLVWFVLPDQYITMFMVAGSSNYIWAAVLNLLFISVFMRFLAKDKKLTNWKWTGICILAFFAGAWMEMYSLALSPALFCSMLLKQNYRNRKMLVAFGLYVVGAVVVIFAPGNFVRQGQAVEGRASVSTFLVNQLELAIKYKLIWVWICILALLMYELLKRRVKMKEFLGKNLVWLIGIVVAYAFLYVSGVNSWRSQWSTFVFSFVVLFWLLDKLRIQRFVYIALSAFVLLAVGVDFSKECHACQTKNNAVAEMLKQAKSETLTEGRYYLWPKASDSRKTIPSPMGVNGSWPGNSFATFHHLNNFIVMPEIAYPYCLGKVQNYPLYYGLFPMVNECAIVKREGASSQSVTLKYEFDVPTAFVFHGKVRRLLVAMGCDDLARRAYVSKDNLFLGKFLLEEMESSDSEVEVSPGFENIYFFNYQDEWYLVAPMEMMRPKYDLTVVSCELR